MRLHLFQQPLVNGGLSQNRKDLPQLIDSVTNMGVEGTYSAFGPPLALISARIHGDVVSLHFCKVITFDTVQSCINFLQRCCINGERVGALL